MINKVGIELEGFYENIPSDGSWKSDASVEFDGHSSGCDGSCRDNCECRSDCECAMCQVCTICEQPTDECNCSDCLTCGRCDCRLDSCECVKRYGNCQNKNCTNVNACDNCIEKFNDDYIPYRKCITQNNCDFDCGCDCTCECTCQNNVGEFVSDLLEVTEAEDWINDNYPSETNNTCGGHIHVSFHSCESYMLLMKKSFHKYYLYRMKRWGEKMNVNKGSAFWRRMGGENRYCKNEFDPIPQKNMTGNNSSRYTHINYCYNLHDRHTIEFRMLPCFQKKYLFVSAFHETISIIEDFLKMTRKADFHIRIEI